MVIRTVVLIAMVIAVTGCPQERTVGFDPATNRCREFNIESQKFVGGFLPDVQCDPEPTPHEVPDDA